MKIISKKPNESTTAFGLRIEAETGTVVQFDWSNDGSSFSITKITFSDGNYVDNKGSAIASGMSIKSDWVVLIDDSNHLFILTHTNYMNQVASASPSSPMTSCGIFMILDLDGLLRIVKTNRYWHEAFNIPYKTNNKPTAQTIKILPAYVYNSDDNTLGYSKNLYINYDRAFNTGLKFIDQNGNRFVTLGSYLLYKVD